MSRKVLIFIVSLFFFFSSALATNSPIKPTEGLNKNVTFHLNSEFSSILEDSFRVFLESVPDNSSVLVVVNSQGGDVSSLIQMIYDIKLARARGITFHGQVAAEAASAAAEFLCQMDDVAYEPNAFVLFHAATVGGSIFSPGTQLIEPNLKTNEDRMFYTWVNYPQSFCNLTKDELYQINVKGVQLYFWGKDLATRNLHKHN
jgi:hypothetical protein